MMMSSWGDPFFGQQFDALFEYELERILDSFDGLAPPSDGLVSSADESEGSAASASAGGASSSQPVNANPTGPTSSQEESKPQSSDAASSSGNAAASQLLTESDANPTPASQSSRPSGLPAVIVSDLPESERAPSSPRVIAQDIADVEGSGAAVGGQEGNKAGQKRKADGSDDDTGLLKDGLHPTQRGSSVLAGNIGRHIRGLFWKIPWRTKKNAPSPKEQRTGDDDARSRAEAERRAEEQRKEELLQRVLTTLRRYRRSPTPPHMEEHIRILPRQGLEQVLEMLRKTEQRFARNMPSHYRRRFPGEFQEAFSDEESDEETLQQEAQNPRPARYTISHEQSLMRSLIFGGVTTVTRRETDPTSGEIAILVQTMINQGEGEEVVRILKDVSVRGRSSRQDCLLFVLAKCCRSNDMSTKKAAYAAVQDICRIPTHIFQLITYIEKGGKTTGWGRGLRKALQMWYNSNASNPMHLAMHLTKYWSRQGWTHRDVFRLLHIKPVNDAIGFIVRYAVKGMKEAEEEYLQDGYLDRKQLEQVHKYLQAVEEVKKCEDVPRAVELVQKHNLVREQLRTELLNSREIWATLLTKMPLHALLRNINKMTNVGLFSEPEMVQTVISKIMNAEAMKKARMHPLKILMAHHVYKQGAGEKGKLTWEANDEIVAALDKAFYRSFEAVEPTNKRILIALDISSSMDSRLQGHPISVREGATVMSMVTVRSEPNCDVVGFHHRLMPLEMFKNRSKDLSQLIAETARLGFGNTDCSKPMIWARKKQKSYDAFIIYTDSETNYQTIPPFVALEKYREKMNIPNAKLIVVGMTSSNITIAQPNDLHMLDVVGFDPDTPEIIHDFLTGGVE